MLHQVPAWAGCARRPPDARPTKKPRPCEGTHGGAVSIEAMVSKRERGRDDITLPPCRGCVNTQLPGISSFVGFFITGSAAISQACISNQLDAGLMARIMLLVRLPRRGAAAPAERPHAPRPTELTSEVRDRIETLFDIRSASDRAPGTARGSAPPGSGSSVGIAAGSPCSRCSADGRSRTRGLPDFDGSDAGLDGALGEVAIAEQLAASPVIPLIGVGLHPGGTWASKASVKTSWTVGCGTMWTYVVDSLRAGHSSAVGQLVCSERFHPQRYPAASHPLRPRLSLNPHRWCRWRGTAEVTWGSACHRQKLIPNAWSPGWRLLGFARG